MGMKRKALIVMAALVVLSIFSIAIKEIGNFFDSRKEEKVATSTDATSTDAPDNIDHSMYYSYSEVETIVSYLADTEEKEKSLGRLIDPLTKSELIDVEYVQDIVEIIGAPVEVYVNELYGMGATDLVTREQFDTIYHNIVDSSVVDGLLREDFLVYEVSDVVSEEGTVSTFISNGDYSYKLGIQLSEEYYDKIIDIYIKDGSIFKVNGLSQTSVSFPNVWFVSVEDGYCNFLYNGQQKSYLVSGENTDTDAFVGVEEGSVVKLTFDNTGVLALDEYSDVLRGRVMDVGDHIFEIENVGTRTYADNFKLYDASGDVFCENSIPVIKGHSEVLLIQDSGKIIAGVIEDEMISQNIRVILSNNTYTSYNMPSVTLSCDTSYKVQYPDDAEAVRTAGKTITISYDNYEDGDIITVEPTAKDGKIQILSIERQYGNPIYEGTIEIRIQEDGLYVINELPLENYLYSVVSSEMPSTNPEEALKAMAICARGYAYTKMKDESFEAYYAHLDDSTLCQVYNNVQATESTIKAVKDTYGIVPVYDGAVIVPMYFSTSCGTTCTNEEIWGGTPYPYLVSNVETVNKESIDLSEEETFIQFMDDSLGYDIIDKDMPYYRWSISFTADEISDAVNSMLEERLSVSSDNIKIKDEDGDFVSTDITDIGKIKSIKVTERSKSGVVISLEIEGTLGTIQITGQTNIRNIITPVNQQIIRQDGSAVTGWTSLPSPFYYIEHTDDTFVIHGGGFGHGAGMSQNGAKVLAEQGYNYMFILRHYYSYIDFSSIYVIEGKKDEE